MSLAGRKAESLLILAVALWMVLGLAACGGIGGSERPIAYVSEQDGNPDVHVIDVETGESEAVSRSPGSEFAPSWSPDGERIAYVVSSRGQRDLIVVEMDGPQAETHLAPEDGENERNEGSPRWATDGDRVAYVSELNGQSDIYVSALEVDGEAEVRTTRITSEDSRELMGDWSPDGVWLVFARQGGDDVEGLWLRNPEGVNLLQLTDGADSDPVWSPDGDAIAFVRDDLGNNDIYIVRPEDGDDWRGEVSEERWLNSPEEDHSPAWAPDGDTLAFVTTRDGNSEIYSANANDDDPPRRLTINEAADTEPVWSPDGERDRLRYRPVRRNGNPRDGCRRNQPAAPHPQRHQGPFARLVTHVWPPPTPRC